MVKTFLTILITFLILTNSFTITARTEVGDNAQRLRRAAEYIIKRYHPVIGLVSESEDTGSVAPDGTPCHRTFWIYSDNLWASQALRRYNFTIAENISKTVASYIKKAGNANLFEVLLGEKITNVRYGKRNICVAYFIIDGENYTIWVDRHQEGDGEIFFDAKEYADLCFYLALNCYLNGDKENATQLLRVGEQMWNGHGFFDKAVNETYQNYKLGLYLFTAKVLGYNSSTYDSVERIAWSYQKENGGIAAQSYLNGTIYGTANVETTSALLLAYDQELIGRFRSLQSQTNHGFPLDLMMVLVSSIILIVIVFIIIYFAIEIKKRLKRFYKR
ncbi:MAG: hypothetical protein QXJ17_06940 [Nitrososphaeria archaeon]